MPPLEPGKTLHGSKTKEWWVLSQDNEWEAHNQTALGSKSSIPPQQHSPGTYRVPTRHYSFIMHLYSPSFLHPYLKLRRVESQNKHRHWIPDMVWMNTLVLPSKKKLVCVMISFFINLCCIPVMWERQHQQIWKRGGSRVLLHPTPSISRPASLGFLHRLKTLWCLLSKKKTKKRAVL